MSKNIIKQPKSIVEVTITMSWADMEAKWNETLQRLALEVELPGFRKGQAPLPMVEQNLGVKLQDEVLKVVMPQALVESLQGTNIIPIDYPKYQLISFTKGNSLSFKAVVTERPEVKVGDYKSIRVQKPAQKTVGDEDVNKLILDLFRRWKAKQPAVKPVEAAPANGPAQSNQGSGSLSFNQTPSTGLVDAQGNPVSSQPPTDTPDDIFAKAVGAQSLDDLKSKIKADLESEAKYNNELDFEEVILQEIEKLTTVEVPEILIEDELNRMLVQLQRRVSDMGLLFDEYLKSQNKTLEGLKSEWRAQAEKNVRMELGLAEVARQEKIEISEEVLQAEIDKIQDNRLKAQFDSQEPRLHLKHSLRQLKTLDFLKTLVKPT